jgi:Icc protein
MRWESWERTTQLAEGGPGFPFGVDADRGLRPHSAVDGLSDWGWGTQDGAEALSYLKRFGSVTVLNGHIHQVVQKVEGNVAFHTATSTAFPQPAPGKAPSAGPMVVPAGELKSVLGITEVKYIARHSHLAIVDSSLAEQA